MVPGEVFKRRPRHNNTPASTLLIITNFITVSADATLFTKQNHINLFFWVVIAGLVLYNFFTIRRNREDFTRNIIIAYIFSNIVVIILFFVLKGQA